MFSKIDTISIFLTKNIGDTGNIGDIFLFLSSVRNVHFRRLLKGKGKGKGLGTCYSAAPLLSAYETRTATLHNLGTGS